MRKAVHAIIILSLISLYGCVLSVKPNSKSVIIDPGETKVFTLAVFPSADNYVWKLDNTIISGATGDTYSFTAEQTAGSSHILRVETSSDFYEWSINVNSSVVSHVWACTRAVDRYLILIGWNGHNLINTQDNIDLGNGQISNGLAWSNDGRYLAVGLRGQVNIYEWDSQNQILKPQPAASTKISYNDNSAINHINWNRDNSLIGASYYDGNDAIKSVFSLLKWDPTGIGNEKLKEVAIYGHEGYDYSFANGFHPDGCTILVGHGSLARTNAEPYFSILRWDGTRLNLIARNPFYTGSRILADDHLHAVRWSKNGTKVMIGSLKAGDAYFGGRIAIAGWENDTIKYICDIKNDLGCVHEAYWTQDEKYIMVAHNSPLSKYFSIFEYRDDIGNLSLFTQPSNSLGGLGYGVDFNDSSNLIAITTSSTGNDAFELFIFDKTLSGPGRLTKLAEYDMGGPSSNVALRK